MVKVNLVYPKIPDSRNSPTKACIAFKKYDGTNLHWVWERELSWYGFGTRRDRFDLDEQGIKDFNQAHPGLEESSEIFLENFAKPLETIFLENPKTNDPYFRNKSFISNFSVSFHTEHQTISFFRNLYKIQL